MNRRGLFKRTALGSLMLSLGGITVVGLRSTVAIDSAPPLSQLSARASAILVAVAATVLQGTSAQNDAARVAHVVRSVDAALGLAPPAAARDLQQALLLLDNALHVLAMIGRPQVFTALDFDQRARVLARWRDSSSLTLRGAYQALRKLCLASHYVEPHAFTNDAHYPGPVMAKPAIVIKPRAHLAIAPRTTP